MIVFGKEIITVVDVDNGDKVLEYNGHKVLLSSIIQFIKGPFNITRLTPEISIRKNGKTITIGCLTDTNENFNKLINILSK